MATNLIRSNVGNELPPIYQKLAQINVQELKHIKKGNPQFYKDLEEFVKVANSRKVDNDRLHTLFRSICDGLDENTLLKLQNLHPNLHQTLEATVRTEMYGQQGYVHPKQTTHVVPDSSSNIGQRIPPNQAKNLLDRQEAFGSSNADNIKTFHAKTIGNDKERLESMSKTVHGMHPRNPRVDENEEIEKLRKENERLRRELEEKPKPAAQMDSKQLRQSLISSLGDKDMKTLEEMKGASEVYLQVENLKRENSKLHTEVDELKNRLARALSTQMDADERDVENTSESCRPTVISKEYEKFCSKQWLRAKEALDAMATLDEKTMCVLLCRTLEVASQSAVACTQTMFENLRVSPGESVDNVDTIIGAHTQAHNQVYREQKILDGERRRVTQEVKVAVTKYLKIFVDDVHTHRWSREVMKKVFAEINLGEGTKLTKDLSTNEYLNKYIVQACKLTWRMAVQLPPMTLVCQPMTYDANLHELAMSSLRPKGRKEIDYYVTPVLMHEPNVAVKGRVMMKKQ